jgi:NAD(P)-dependent dehydrogenase (short-subunit alcohol dehydrogenase family)
MQQVQALVNDAAARLTAAGGGLDVLVSNAGIAGPTKLEEIDEPSPTVAPPMRSPSCSRRRITLHESCQNCFNQLKRKENALVLSHGSFVAQKSIGPIQTTKRNENNMLDRRFAVAPMMDWVESL